VIILCLEDIKFSISEKSGIRILKNVYKLKTIGITTGGKNYTSAPNVIAVGNSSILTRTSIQGSSVSKIEIILVFNVTIWFYNIMNIICI
jgi:hypothetical protein